MSLTELKRFENGSIEQTLIQRFDEMKTHNVWPSVFIGFMLSFLVLAGCSVTIPVPTNLTATAGDGEVTLSWQAVTKATSYNIYWSTTSGVTPSNGMRIFNVTSTSYVQTGLINGTTYYYVVTAVNLNGDTSSVTSQASATPSGGLLPGPSDVAATPGDSQVVISWDAVAGASSYNIYWSTTSGVSIADGNEIAGLDSLSYTQTGLTNGTTYYYMVTAETSTGESAASFQASAIPAVNPAPAEPVGLTASSGNGQARIVWAAVPGATSYNIYWSTISDVTPATGTQITDDTTLGYTQVGLTNGTTYYYVVTALNADGESTASIQVSVTPSQS